MAETFKTILSESVCAAIDRWIMRYPPEQKRSGVIEALRLAQEDNKGYLTPEIMGAVAAYLDIPTTSVYEAATFYSMFNLKPVGKHVINVCTNISCMLQGAEEILAHFKNLLGIGLNETTPDGKFTLREVECLAACANAPVAHIGPKYYEDLTQEKVDNLLKELGGNHGK